MRSIESKPIPLKSKGLTGDLKRLKQPTDSFLIENKGLKRAVLYSTASRLGIRLITQVEGDGLRVWRNFDVVKEVEIPSPLAIELEEMQMTREEKLSNLLADPKPFLEPVPNEWIDIGEKWNDITGEMVEMQRHFQNPNKFREKPKDED